jgi:phosphopentomutase
MRRRAFLVVLDACGVGALPDAAEYGDAGTNTLGHVAEAVGGLSLQTLERLGLGSIVPLRGVAPAPSPTWEPPRCAGWRASTIPICQGRRSYDPCPLFAPA